MTLAGVKQLMLFDNQRLIVSTFLRGHGPRYASRTSSSPSKPVRPRLKGLPLYIRSRAGNVKWHRPVRYNLFLVFGVPGGRAGTGVSMELKTQALDRVLE